MGTEQGPSGFQLVQAEEGGQGPSGFQLVQAEEGGQGPSGFQLVQSEEGGQGVKMPGIEPTLQYLTGCRMIPITYTFKRLFLLTCFKVKSLQ